ncbi:MAG: hypothetical protein FJ318_03640 [SAR202 cluster bacterium]|nr:hypothetical protein [SAR202 cluster bacterium]
MTITRWQTAGTAIVLAMTAASIAVVRWLEAWVGTWLGPFWVACCFLTPFLAGLALGGRVAGLRGRVLGAGIGVLTAGGPMAAYAAVGGDTAAFPQAALALVFVPLAAAQGSIAMPVGGAALSRRRSRT